VIAVDTNVLVHAHRGDSPTHGPALARLRSLATGAGSWGLPVACVAEFVRVVTHRRVFDPPSTLGQAREAIEGLLRSPSIHLLSEGPRFPALFFEAAEEAGATGNLAFDARIVAVCREHGVRRILTQDRDFARFSGLEVERLEDA
jgi:toxin-antitoxin system PIN domain toxin